ncbi:50S ribosome-binding GTPase [Candidatus Woesearchaeota archaeon]|nr:50S ribosome-binding GTPase [Candidatus Woesearchaeota archaeon]
MNFQTIPPVESSKKLLDLAFRKAREKAQANEMRGDVLKAIKRKESLKIAIINDVLTSHLNKILRDFPETEKLPSFNTKLMHLTLDFPLFKQSFGAMRWAIGKISFLQRGYKGKINQEKNRFHIGEVSREFYGRISSVVKQIDKNLQYLEAARKIMRTYPDVKDLFTVCIYGFPNVGKTTLLNKLTTAKAEVAAYAFTTKSINAGYLKIGEEMIQVLDVPGTLARPDKMNLIERQAELVLEELADLVLFVFDLSEQGGYSVEKQEQLLKKLGKDKKVLVYLSKVDLADSEALKRFKPKHCSLAEIKEEIMAKVRKE